MAILKRWSAVEEMEGTLRKELGLDLAVMQLEGGRMGGDAVACRFGVLTLLRMRMERSLHSWGPKPAGQITICLDLDPRPQRAALRSHGQELPEACLFDLDPRRETHLTLPSPTSFCVVMVESHALERWAADLGWPDLNAAQAFRGNWLAIDPQRCEGLRRYLRQVFALAEQDPKRLQRAETQRLVLEDLMPLLIEALVHGSGQIARLARAPARIELVKQAQRWMLEHPLEPITLAALCQEMHVSRRCLIQGFREHLGMGPMAFLKLQRLHGVRRILIGADPELQRIGPVATEWGFLNPGHFARDYRQLFGERPRETLQRRAAA
jgi:AraC family ethanolamine operon transcriptional activator